MVDLEKLRIWDDPGETLCADAAAEIERLRAFIQSLDGKTIAIRSGDNEFVDDGIIVASDILR